MRMTKALADEIEIVRHSRGWSWSDMEKATGLSSTGLSNHAHGRTVGKPMFSSTVDKLAKVIGYERIVELCSNGHLYPMPQRPQKPTEPKPVKPQLPDSQQSRLARMVQVWPQIVDVDQQTLVELAEELARR